MAFTLLNANWTRSGTNKNEFFELCKEVDKNTTYDKLMGPNLRSFGSVTNDTICYKGGMLIPLAGMQAEGMEDIYLEMINSKSPIVAAGGEIFLSNNRAIAEMANLKGLHGSALVKPTEKRDAFIEELVSGTKMTAVVRRSNGYAKIMSIRSDKYKAIPLAILEDVFEGFMDNEVIGKYQVVAWTMDQDTASIQVEFPDIGDDLRVQYPELPEKWFPGVFIKSGTTGYTPVSVEMYYRKENGEPVYAGRAYAKHFAAFDKDNFIKKVQNDIWGKYLQMPEKLSKATQIMVLDVEKCLKAIFSFIKINKVFQKKDTETCRYLDKSWNVALNALNAIKAQRILTVYDVMDVVMEIPSRVTVPEAYKQLLSEACGRAWTYEA